MKSVVTLEMFLNVEPVLKTIGRAVSSLVWLHRETFFKRHH